MRSTLLIRCSMVLLWIVLCGLFLTLPWISFYLRPRNTLTILAMPNALNVDMFDAFTKKTGIKVSLSYAENADEIGMKLRATRGRGYDLIMVADYQVPQLINAGIIQRFDKSLLDFFDDLYPALLDHPFDPENRYSIPYCWGVYGFGIDKNYFGADHHFSWSDLFAPSGTFMVGMRDDIRELIFIAAYYLFGHASDLTEEQYDQITALLIAQKRNVIMYADERIDALLVSGTSPFVLTLSSDIARAMSVYPQIDFVIPEGGSFVDIDSFVLSAACNNKTAAYQFLNYLYSEPVLSYYTDRFRLSPPRSAVNSDVKIPLLTHPTEELFSQLRFFDTVIPQYRINAILVALKSA